MNNIGIIGGGNMGEAIIASCRKRFVVRVSEKDVKRQRYLKKCYRLVSCSVKELAQFSNIVILAVKPQDIEIVLKELSGVVRKNTLIISIAAGITTSFIEKNFKQKVRVIRTMPNMPALINEGITAIAKGRFASDTDAYLACKIFNKLGETVMVKEGLIDAITAVSGSGPAYVFLFMECLIKAAKSLGLNEALAAQLVKKTFSGSLNLLIQKNIDPAVLRAKVTSKGGTTQAALDVFSKKKLDFIIKEALNAAKKRAKVLSRR